MNAGDIQQSFRDAVANSVQLLSEGVDRYLVFTPFHFDDGDHFVIVLHKRDGRWRLTDEGHTYMHLSYHVDRAARKRGIRNEVIESALEKHGVRDEGGRLVADLNGSDAAGNVFYNYIQCLVSIANVAYLSSERVKSTFMDDLREFLAATVDPKRITFDYRDSSRDPDGNYPVDCMLNGMRRPLYLYGIQNDAKCRDVTIYIRQFQEWNIPCSTLAVFESQEEISRKVLARFTDVCDRQFSNLAQNQTRIQAYIAAQM